MNTYIFSCIELYVDKMSMKVGLAKISALQAVGWLYTYMVAGYYGSAHG